MHIVEALPFLIYRTLHTATSQKLYPSRTKVTMDGGCGGLGPAPSNPLLFTVTIAAFRASLIEFVLGMVLFLVPSFSRNIDGRE